MNIFEVFEKSDENDIDLEVYVDDYNPEIDDRSDSEDDISGSRSRSHKPNLSLYLDLRVRKVKARQMLDLKLQHSSMLKSY